MTKTGTEVKMSCREKQRFLRLNHIMNLREEGTKKRRGNMPRRLNQQVVKGYLTALIPASVPG